MPTAKILDQKHPAYDADGLQVRRALFQGGRLWHELAGKLLPKHEIEPERSHAARVDRATYENHFGPLIGLMTGTLFSEAPRLAPPETERPEHVDYWTRLQERADRVNLGWSQWWRDRADEALWAGRAWAWLDLPAAAPAATFVDQVTGGALDAYLCTFPPEAVLDWGADSRGLTFIRAKTTHREALDPLAEAKTITRWTVIDRETIRRFVWTGKEPPKPDDDVPIEGEPIRHGWTDAAGLPIIPVMAIDLPTGLQAGERMQDPALAHLRSSNEHGWALFRAAVLILLIKSRFGADDEDKRPTLGQGTYLALGTEEDASWLEPSGSVFTHLAADVVERRTAIYRVVHQMAVAVDPSAAKMAQSAESKGLDWKATEVILSSLSEVILDAMRWAVGSIARLRKCEAPEVSGLDGWHHEDTGPWLEQAAMALEAKRSPTFVQILGTEMARRMLPLATPEQLQAIVDELTADAEMSRLPAGGTGGQNRTPEPTPGATG